LSESAAGLSEIKHRFQTRTTFWFKI